MQNYTEYLKEQQEDAEASVGADIECSCTLATIPNYEATVTLGDGQAFVGASITVNLDPNAEPLTGELVKAAEVARVCGNGGCNGCLHSW